jgi:hypothetical protein
MYDSNNHAIWTRQFGNGSRDYVRAIATGSDAVYVSAHLNNSAFMRKYDLSGVEKWTDLFNPYVDATTQALAVGSAVYSADTVYMNNTDVIFLHSFDFGGNLQWTRLVANYSGEVYGLYQNAGGLYLAGTGRISNQGGGVVGPFLGKYDLQGHPIWIDTVDMPNVNLMSISGDIQVCT